MLAEYLPLRTPVPMRIGQPSRTFKHHWTIARWVEGEPADRAPITRRSHADHTPITRIDAAETLAQFLRALHHRAPADAPRNALRGIPLAELPGVDSGFDIIADRAAAAAAR
jgi:hypothetical protein